MAKETGHIAGQRYAFDPIWRRILQGVPGALFLAVYFIACCVAIGVTQIFGAPLYLVNRAWFYSWMAFTKAQFGVVIASITHWCAPVTVRVSGDESVSDQLKKDAHGDLECDFPERIVLIANHQMYNDWVYLWWVAYTARAHGYVYFILKESLQYIPVLAVGMKFYGFVFLSRKWAKDKERFQYRLQKLSESSTITGSQRLPPMWLLMFPEGTNLCASGRASSQRWAHKNNLNDLRYSILPRSTGLLYCLLKLEKTVEFMYDCTIAYEGIPAGTYGEEYFTLQATYLQGRPPRSVNMHWRRFAIKDIPIGDASSFRDWLLARWREKDSLLEYYAENGHFPAGVHTRTYPSRKKPTSGSECIEVEVRPRSVSDILCIFTPPLALVLATVAIAYAVTLVL